MYHVPIIRNVGTWSNSPCYDPISATAAVVSAGGQAYAQIAEGKANKAWSDYNASLAEGEARIIDIKKGIEKGQYQRAKGKYLSSAVVDVAGSGLMPSGSKMAVVNSSLAQMEIDQAIGQFNYEMEKSYAMGKMEAYKRQGKRAVRQAYAKGFTALLKGAMSAATSFGVSAPAGGGYSAYGNLYGSGTPLGARDMGTFTSIKKVKY